MLKIENFSGVCVKKFLIQASLYFALNMSIEINILLKSKLEFSLIAPEFTFRQQTKQEVERCLQP